MTDLAPFQAFAATVTTPMHIVTTRGVDGAEGDGCLVGFSTQCSIEPLRFLACLSKVNETYEAARHARTLVVHVLHDAEPDRTLAHIFGEETGHRTDKFTQCAWREGPDGTPVLRGVDHFIGHVLERVDLGDHVGFLLEVDGGATPRSGEPLLTYQQVRDLDAGNEVDADAS
jgi:flavin reductase (DIM6/NTAB) family NADH-FMN oxidoreductase RutF